MVDTKAMRMFDWLTYLQSPWMQARLLNGPPVTFTLVLGR